MLPFLPAPGVLDLDGGPRGLRVAWAPPLRAPHLYGAVVRMAEWVNRTPAFKRPIKTGLAVRCRALNSVQIGRNVCIWPCDRVSGFRTRIAAISHEF